VVEKHEPDPKFVERLEWQLMSENRRRDRYGNFTWKRREWRYPKMILTILFSLFVGIGATRTVDHINDAARKQLLAAKAEVVQNMAENRYQATLEHQKSVQKMVDEGLVEESEAQDIAFQTEKMALDVMRSQIDLQEIRETGNTPRNDLSAPLADGRDFVTERLELDIKSIKITIRHMKAVMRRVEIRKDYIRDAEGEVEHYQRAIETERSRIIEIDKKINLRRQYLRGDLSAEDVELYGLVDAARAKMLAASDRVDKAKTQLHDIEERVEQGIVSASELTWAKLSYQSAESELRLAELDLNLAELELDKRSKD
jgi:hypothetical protein